MKQNYLYAFLFVSVLHLTACITENVLLTQLSKPFLLFFLYLFFIKSITTQKSGKENFVRAALLFSLVGDCLLLFASRMELYFILGLLAFLLAHANYSIAFYKALKSNVHKPSKSEVLLCILPFLVIVIGSILFFNNTLGALFVPVVIYMIVIGTMGALASMRFKAVSRFSYSLVLLGAVLFIVSDFILAYNKFYQEIRYSGFYIMLTYLLAQLFIVRGIIEKKEVDGTK